MRRKTVFFVLSLGLTVAALAHRAEAAICTDGSTRNFRTGTCCSLDRSLYEVWECQGGFWSPTGEYFCSGICVEF